MVHNSYVTQNHTPVMCLGAQVLAVWARAPNMLIWGLSVSSPLCSLRLDQNDIISFRFSLIICSHFHVSLCVGEGVVQRLRGQPVYRSLPLRKNVLNKCIYLWTSPSKELAQCAAYLPTPGSWSGETNILVVWLWLDYSVFRHVFESNPSLFLWHLRTLFKPPHFPTGITKVFLSLSRMYLQ